MTIGIADIHATLEQARHAIERLAAQRRAETITPEDLVWAALTLANDSATCTSILAGRPVLTRNLDPRQLHHAQRGAAPPHPDAYIAITKPMLHAIIEAGPTHDDDPAPAPPPDNVIPLRGGPPRLTPPRTRIPR